MLPYPPLGRWGTGHASAAGPPTRRPQGSPHAAVQGCRRKASAARRSGTPRTMGALALRWMRVVHCGLVVAAAARVAAGVVGFGIEKIPYLASA